MGDLSVRFHLKGEIPQVQIPSAFVPQAQGPDVTLEAAFLNSGLRTAVEHILHVLWGHLTLQHFVSRFLCVCSMETLVIRFL